ncbi:hypothetical protein AAC691_16795 [Nguyenibacter vanlangensis]|uniref:Uncharacterized protein n=1 Tax=Nguyenibacter vanlangensis TaxID=1216886 RepID=A0ABZ3D2D5_9PROT
MKKTSRRSENGAPPKANSFIGRAGHGSMPCHIRTFYATEDAVRLVSMRLKVDNPAASVPCEMP